MSPVDSVLVMLRCMAASKTRKQLLQYLEMSEKVSFIVYFSR